MAANVNLRYRPATKKTNFKDKEKPTEVRASNITAAKGLPIHII